VAAPSTFENLDSSARDSQLRAGVFTFATGLAIAAVLVRVHAGAGVRVLLFFPFFFGIYCVVSALLGTCGVSALMRRRISCGGAQRMGDRRHIAGARRRGMMVLTATATASALATIAMMIAH
jgi:hypothetical protein